MTKTSVDGRHRAMNQLLATTSMSANDRSKNSGLFFRGWNLNFKRNKAPKLFEEMWAAANRGGERKITGACHRHRLPHTYRPFNKGQTWAPRVL